MRHFNKLSLTKESPCHFVHDNFKRTCFMALYQDDKYAYSILLYMQFFIWNYNRVHDLNFETFWILLLYVNTDIITAF